MRLIISVLIAGATLFSATANAADTKPVAELFGCTFNEGKTWDDFEKTNAFFTKQLKKIGGKADDFNAFVWMPFRANLEFTYLWNGYYANLATWGEATQAYLDSEEGAAADERWEELETCGSALVYVDQIYDSQDFPPATPTSERAMLESFRCTLQPGKSMADLDAALKTWQGHMQALSLPIDVFMRTPLVNSSGGVTHTYFSVHENAAAYGANVSTYQTHIGTPAIEEMLGGVQSCTNALWLSWQVFDGDTQ